ncbi:unnamed protein product, partial [Chrysoparadoxa australica]
YESSTAVSLVEIKRKFTECRLEPGASPDTWLHELEYLRSRTNLMSTGSIDDATVLAHMMANLPREYSEVITLLEDKTRQDASTLTLKYVSERLRMYYDRVLKGKHRGSKAVFRGGFKGRCRKCNAIGHKSFECQKKSMNKGTPMN